MSTHKKKQYIHAWIWLKQSPHREARKTNKKIIINMTKQIGNNDPSSTLIIINFTPILLFLKS